MLSTTASLNDYNSSTNCTSIDHLSAPNVGNVLDWTVGTFRLVDHENYERFF